MIDWVEGVERRLDGGYWEGWRGWDLEYIRVIVLMVGGGFFCCYRKEGGENGCGCWYVCGFRGKNLRVFLFSDFYFFCEGKRE